MARRTPGEIGGSVRREASLADQVAQSVLDSVLRGDINPGDRLPSERELGDRFEVSRTVVREAIRSLAAKGVVSVRTGSGATVAAVGASAASESLNLYLRGSGELDYGNVHEMRVILEVAAAGLAAVRATAGDLESLSEAEARMERASATKRMARWDVEFHRALALATHNQLFLVLHDAIGEALMDVRLRTLALGSKDDAARAHRAILSAVSKGDVEGAERAMRRHLESVARFQARHSGSGGAT